MNTMALAMMNAGLVSDQDLQRMKNETEKQQRQEQEEKNNRLREDKALSTLGWLKTEIKSHMNTYPGTIGMDTLEKWAQQVEKEKCAKDQFRVATRCWAMYLCHFRDQASQS